MPFYEANVIFQVLFSLVFFFNQRLREAIGPHNHNVGSAMIGLIYMHEYMSIARWFSLKIRYYTFCLIDLSCVHPFCCVFWRLERARLKQILASDLIVIYFIRVVLTWSAVGGTKLKPLSRWDSFFASYWLCFHQ